MMSGTNTELLELSSVEMRRRIGTKEISPVELLEAVDRAHRRTQSRRSTPYAPRYTIAPATRRKARRKGRACRRTARPLHGLPTGIKDLHETEGLLTTYGSPLYRDFVPSDAAMVALRAQGRRHHRRQDQRARIRRRRQHAQRGMGSNRQSVQSRRSMRAAPRAARRWRSPATCCRSAPAPTPAARCASRRPICGVVGFRPSPGLVPMDGRPLGWTPISVLGPMGRTVADTRLLFAAQIGMDDRDPLAVPLDPAAIARARPADLGRLRVALTEDFGQCPVIARDPRRLPRARSPPCATCSARATRWRSISARPIAASTWCARENFVARYRDAYDKDPSSLGPNVRANYEMGAR